MPLKPSELVGQMLNDQKEKGLLLGDITTSEEAEKRLKDVLFDADQIIGNQMVTVPALKEIIERIDDLYERERKRLDRCVKEGKDDGGDMYHIGLYVALLSVAAMKKLIDVIFMTKYVEGEDKGGEEQEEGPKGERRI